MFLIAVLLGLAAVRAHGEDIVTTNGTKYTGATISRVEPDGIMVMHSAGIVKIPFSELSDELQRKYNYDAAAGKKFAAETEANQQRLRDNTLKQVTAMEVAKTRQQLEDEIKKFAVLAEVKPFIFGQETTTAHIDLYVDIDTRQPINPLLKKVNPNRLDRDGESFIGVIAEPMAEGFESGNQTGMVLYKIGHTHDSSRNPLFTTKMETVIKYLREGRAD